MLKKLLFIGFAILSIGAIASIGGAEEVSGSNNFARDSTTTATFAAGCFWCTESLFQELDGVEAVVSGYAGGEFENPTYLDVINNITDHREAVQVTFDPGVISYRELVDMMLRSIDPTDNGGQFVDRGFSYTTAIFTHSEEQEDIAEEALDQLRENDRFDGFEIVTPVLDYTTFYDAEGYHQDFYIKSPERYKEYNGASGREEFRQFVWEQISSEQESLDL